jgi:hypothetical protein
MAGRYFPLAAEDEAELDFDQRPILDGSATFAVKSRACSRPTHPPCPRSVT